MTAVWLSGCLAGALIGCTTTTPAPITKEVSLAEAWQAISNKTFVDLTHTFSPTTPVWSGFGPASFTPSTDPATGHPYTIEHDGFRAFQYLLVGQYGTHI